jgi:hypothetical protein
MAMWGEVRSIEFLGIASHGLDMDESDQLAQTQNAHDSMLMQWELYTVTLHIPVERERGFQRIVNADSRRT